jgi:hypothetical protein
MTISQCQSIETKQSSIKTELGKGDRCRINNFETTEKNGGFVKIWSTMVEMSVDDDGVTYFYDYLAPWIQPTQLHQVHCYRCDTASTLHTSC